MPNIPPVAVSSHVAIPLPSNEELDPALIGQVASEDSSLLRMMSGTGEMFPGIVELGRAIFRAEGIDPRLRELILLRTSMLLGCAYEWRVHEVIAQSVGVSAEWVDAMASAGTPSGLGQEEDLVIRLADELTRVGSVQDATLKELRAAFDDVRCRKLIMIASWANLTCRFVNGCRVPAEPSDTLAFRGHPLR